MRKEAEGNPKRCCSTARANTLVSHQVRTELCQHTPQLSKTADCWKH